MTGIHICYVQFAVLLQIPQICHFVLLCAVPLGLSGIPVYELERSFLMPRESSALQHVMTSLLSTPFQRLRSAFTVLSICISAKEIMFPLCLFVCRIARRFSQNWVER